MKPLIPLIVLLGWAITHAQSLVLNTRSTDLTTFDAEVLGLRDPRGDLSCSVAPTKPELGFDFLFHAGYRVTIPMKQLAGANNALTIVLRVDPGRLKDQRVFVQSFDVPTIGRDATGDAVLEGTFRLGKGRYHVDWLMRDRDGRTCARVWDVEANVTGKDMTLSQELAKDLIQPVESTPFHEKPSVPRQPVARPLNVKVIINFAPQSRETAVLRQDDLEGLIAILRRIDGEPRIGSISLVACSVVAQRVMYRQQNSSHIDLPALGQALKPLNFASLDVKRLRIKNGESDFLAQLVAEETRGDHSDGLIFVSPKYLSDGSIARELVEHLRDSSRPVFYLNYSPDLQYAPWHEQSGHDEIDHLVKQLRGSKYTIGRPRDLSRAWSDILSRLLVSSQKANQDER